MLAKLGADGRKSLGEFHHMFVFRALANFTKTRMVAVLLAALGIATRGLDVPIRRRADPNVSPGEWDGERLDAPKDVSFCHPGAIRTSVGKALP